MKNSKSVSTKPTYNPELRKESLLNRTIHRCSKLPWYASYHSLGISHRRPGIQPRVQRCAHGAEVTGRGRAVSRDRAVSWRIDKLLWLLRAFGDTLCSQGPRVNFLPHHDHLLLQQLPLAVVEAVELPLPLSEHLSVEWGLRGRTAGGSKYTNKQTAIKTNR